jgi:hypothetical protein
MTDAQTFEMNAPWNQPTRPFLDVSKLPDQPEPPALDISRLPDLPDELKPRVTTEDPYNAVISAPHDEETYNDLLRNATSDEDLLQKLFGKTVMDAVKRLYAPDTTSPKAIAAAQNAIAVSELTGFKVSPAAYLENPDAYNEALFGTGHAREKIVMGLASMLPMLVEGTPTGASAEGVVDTAGAIAAAWRSWRAGLWSLPLGIAGFTAIEKANALIRSYIEGKPFSKTQPYGLQDILPPQADEGAREVVDLLDMFAKSKAIHAGFKGLGALWDAMAYDKVSQILPSKKLYISADAIRRNFGEGTEGNAGDYQDILGKLNLSPGQIEDAAERGLDIEVPLSAVVTSSDAPWFDRLKNFLRTSPGKIDVEFSGEEPEAPLHSTGEVEARTVSSEVGTETPAEGEQPPEKTAVPKREPAPPEAEERPRASAAQTPSPSAPGESLKSGDDHLQNSGSAKAATPEDKPHDALLPFIREVSENHDVPANIVEALAWKESGYDADLFYSKKPEAPMESGAKRSIPEEAAASSVDDVYRAVKKINAQTEYLRTLYDRFGDWRKAVAACASEEAAKFLADNPEAKVEAVPNYPANIEPLLDAAEKFRAGGEPAPETSNDTVSAPEKATDSKAGPEGSAAGIAPIVGKDHEEYIKLSKTPEFKEWFGDSKVVYGKEGANPYLDLDGTPGDPRMVFYAVSPKHTDLFLPDERGVILFSSLPQGAKDICEGSDVYPAYLKIENPLEIKSKDYFIDSATIDKAKAQGNDGIILNWLDFQAYAVFSPDQIKSPLKRGIFNPGEADTLTEEAGGSSPGFNTLAHIFKQIVINPVVLIGLRVRSHADLAVLAQAWRNPYYEEFRYVYLRDGVIIDHEGYTCRLPMMTKAFLGDHFEGIRRLKERITALGADSVYLVHNHSCGHVEASSNDVDTTIFIGREIPELAGHVIINSGEYVFLDRKGRDKLFSLPNLPEKWIDPILTPSVPHEILSNKFKTPEDIAKWAKVLTADRNKPLLVYLTPRFIVRGLQEINPDGPRDWLHLADVMPGKLVEFGSKFAVLILPQRSLSYMFEIGQTLVTRGVFYDVVSADRDGPHSVKEIGAATPESVFGGRPYTDFPPQPIR